MTRFTRRAAAAAIVCAALTTGALAAEFESPPSFRPAALGSAWRGPNYIVEAPVTSDGFLRHYRIRTNAGLIGVIGDQLVAARIGELRALQALSTTNDVQQFGQSVARTAMGPVVFAGNLIRNPLGTTEGAVKGVGNVVSGIGSGINNMGQSRDSALASVSGQAREQRVLAAKLGVDPYSDFPPLAARLNELSGAGAVGSLAVSGAFIAVPGVAGLAVSNVSGANTLGALATDYSSAQLMDMNRAKLGALGVDPAVANALFANPNYTPLDTTVMAQAAARIGAAENLGAMISRASTANDRADAYFIRKRMELTAAQVRATGPATAYLGAESLRFPLVKTGSGVLAAYPIDILSWTPETASIIDGLTAQAKAAGGSSRVFAITGTATPLARRNLAAAGWTVKERASF